MTTNHQYARLRAVDAQPAEQDGQRIIVLRDPLDLNGSMVAMPPQLAPLLLLCDGTHSPQAMADALAERWGLRVKVEVIERFIEVCDQALLLDNAHYRAASRQALLDYRAAPYRRPALAGVSYPADPGELAQMFAGYMSQAHTEGLAKAPAARPPATVENADRANDGHDPHAPLSLTGIISPHIDYQRGGPVYAAVWEAAAAAARAADLVIVFGTDHYGSMGSLTPTPQSYATPFGVLPTERATVEALEHGLGAERAYANELHHRSEHAIELAITWLHYMRRDLPAPAVVPILCGSFAGFVAGRGRPEQDPGIGTMVYTLQEAMAGRRVLVVAAADLAHVGPAFEGEPQGPAECAAVRRADDEIIDRMVAGDAQGFFASVQAVGDRYNVCGLSPIYLALRLLGSRGGDGRGQRIAYASCPADDAETSFVTICGVTL